MRKILVCCLLSQARGWGTRQVSSPVSEDVLEGALAVLVGHLCPTAAAVSRSRVLCAIRGMVSAGNQTQAPAAAKPLPSASSFTHQELQQSAGDHSAREALKIWLRTGTCISNSFPSGKAGGQAARSYNKPRDLCYVHQDVAKGKKDAGYSNF